MIALTLTVFELVYFILFTLKKEVRFCKCKTRNGIIRWQISKSIKVVGCMFELALAVSEILPFKKNELEKVGKVAKYNISYKTVS